MKYKERPGRRVEQHAENTADLEYLKKYFPHASGPIVTEVELPSREEQTQLTRSMLNEARSLPVTDKSRVEALTQALTGPTGPSLLMTITARTGDPALAEQIVGWVQQSLLMHGQIKVRVDAFPDGHMEIFDCIQEAVVFRFRTRL